MKLFPMMTLAMMNPVESGPNRNRSILQRKVFREHHQSKQPTGFGTGTSVGCGICDPMEHRLWRMKKFAALAQLAEEKGLESYYSRLFRQYFPHIYN